MSAATKVALIKEAEAPFPERAFAVETLELARLLCEGHNNEMQDYLFEQPTQGTAIDIWSSAVDLLLNLDSELDSLNFNILEKCLETLVEGTQVSLLPAAKRPAFPCTLAYALAGTIASARAPPPIYYVT